ncbi:MAG: hypothetical protein A3B23_03440 [Candidatus Colwellbacteria bacterium RIFCSPLOWO2_01_FULL_48_10]|uniref:Four helix bundle protein n=2 Tax=Bacteria candidate phyla TaxID=1783234 RepID=A0A1F5P207_9BACT|nr:MAG: hypothetical protein A2846_00810 [Candidatus Doudnabacteria bacterium RIFCSPHIGHO2_01_FULL_49_9]OGY59695.1 MAG: hypothetical protein A3B23_03440 [Candidatus Colwellbacteria bacterium RIFCSPLOWO2_01_FULL_48_10]
MQSNSEFKIAFKKRLYQWVLRLVKFVDSLRKEDTHGVIGKQLLRSGTSILANYIEAQSASSRKDFINFLNHSLKSANESKVWLMLLKDTNKGDQKEVQWLLEELIEMANMIGKSLLTLKQR